MKPLALCALLFLASPAAAQSLTSSLKDSDYARAWDMVFVSEGYRSDQEQLFLSDARRMARMLRQGSTAKPIRDAYTINLHFLFVPSPAHVSWRPGGSPGETALRSFVDRDGVLVTDDALADTLAITHAPDVDSIVVVAKLDPPDAIDPATLGGLAQVVSHPDHVRANADMPYDGGRVRQPSGDPEAFIHELGHALFGLGDEYGEYPERIPPDSEWEVALTPNLSVDPSGARWAHVTDSVFEGGGYYERGVYRAERSCRMRESRSRPFCAVCQAAIAAAPGAPVHPAPRLRAPAAGAALAAGQVEVRWRAEQDPIYFWLQVYSGEDLVVDVYLEGHRRSFALTLAQPGSYELSLSAVNLRDDSSPPAERVLELRAANALGLSDALAPEGQ